MLRSCSSSSRIDDKRPMMVFFLVMLLSTVPTRVVHAEEDALPQLRGDALPTVTCNHLARSGGCKNEMKYMKENCKETCLEWSQVYSKFKPFKLPQDEFYELSAIKSNTKKATIEFDQFEGYVTLILPLAKMCTNVNKDKNDNSPKVAPESVFESIERLAQVYPHAVEVLVFPYKHPDVNYDQHLDCKEFDTIIQTTNEKYKKMKQHRNIHVMQEVNLKQNDEKQSRVHPVFQLFLKLLKFQEFVFDTQFYFIVKPDGIDASYHYGKSLLDMQDELGIAVKDLGQREL